MCVFIQCDVCVCFCPATMWHGHSWLYMHQCQLTGCTKGCSNGQLWNSLFITTSIIVHRFVVLPRLMSIWINLEGTTQQWRWYGINHRLTEHIINSTCFLLMVSAIPFGSFVFNFTFQSHMLPLGGLKQKHILPVSPPQKIEQNRTNISCVSKPIRPSAHPSERPHPKHTNKTPFK